VLQYQLPRSSVCPRFYFDPLPGFSRALVAAYSAAYHPSIIARVKDPRSTFALVTVYTFLRHIRSNGLERWFSEDVVISLRLRIIPVIISSLNLG